MAAWALEIAWAPAARLSITHFIFLCSSHSGVSDIMTRLPEIRHTAAA